MFNFLWEWTCIIFLEIFSDFYVISEKTLVEFSVKNSQNSPDENAIFAEKSSNIEI